MPTALSHPAVPVAIGLGLGRAHVSARLLAAGAVASVLPDLDVIGFRLGIPYASALGHRGLSHSLAFAVAVAVAGAALHRALRSRPLAAFAFLLVATASHGILDAFTTGGLGVAFLWPFSSERFFFGAHVIRVSPLGLGALSTRGAAVLASELLWVWGPSAFIFLALAATRRRAAAPPAA